MRNRTYTADAESGDTVIVVGQIHEVRNLDGIAFLILRGAPGKIQVKFEKDEMDDDFVKTGLGVHRESIISVTGGVDEEPRVPTGVEITPESLDIIARAEAQLPLDPFGKVDVELSTRLDNRTLDLRKDKVKAIFEIRAEVRRAVRDKFCDLRATEINVLKIVATGIEGGTEPFPIIYFGQEAFINQPPQLFRQLMIGPGLERAFGIDPTFRAEEHNIPRHLNGATSIDFEPAFINHTEAMNICEAVVAAAYRAVEENCQDELEALGLEEGFEAPSGKFPRLAYKEVIERINATDELDEQLVRGDDLPTESEKALGEDVGEHYPITN